MKKLLITRLNYDEGTAYLSAWSQKLIQKGTEAGYNVIRLDGPDVVKTEVVGRIEALRPKIVCLNGHGDEETYLGHKHEKIIGMENAGILEGTMTFVRACECLDKLGKQAVEKGCKAFIGYRHKFVCPVQAEYSTTPLKDPTAKPVMEASNRVVESLIGGSTPQEAVEKSKRVSKENIRKVMFSKEFSEDIRFSQTLFALVNNLGGLGIAEKR